jgi:hypothetical protein
MRLLIYVVIIKKILLVLGYRNPTAH